MTGTTERMLRLDDLGDAARGARFGQLQERMLPVWDAMRRDLPGESIVVVPSVVPEQWTTGAGLQAYEERFLFLLFLLRQPLLNVVYVTGRHVPPDIVDYYLGLLPGVIASQARRRLHMVAADDGAPRALAAKLLERPRLLAEIRALIPDPTRCHLIPYSTTALERDLALSLGVPLYGADPRLLPLGTKTGCRRLFAEAGVPHPRGREDVRDVADVVDALAEMRASGPLPVRAVVKHDEGASGRGNALVDLRDLPAPGAPDERDALRRRVEAMALENSATSLEAYLARLAADGGIVEEHVGAEEVRSPSVQLRVTPHGAVEILSTHDQVLGGPSGQRYEGCRFPADPAYAVEIAAAATRIADRLAALGVLGRFAVDFVVVRDGAGAWRPYAIELNLRKGGTTHPYLTLQFLTDGAYDAEAGTFTTAAGQVKHLVATDHLEAPALRGMTVDDLFDVAVRHRLHFDHARQTGVVFHMMSALSELGLLGMTAVEDGPEAADALFRRAEGVLLDEAARQEAPVLPPV